MNGRKSARCAALASAQTTQPCCTLHNIPLVEENSHQSHILRSRFESPRTTRGRPTSPITHQAAGSKRNVIELHWFSCSPSCCCSCARSIFRCCCRWTGYLLAHDVGGYGNRRDPRHERMQVTHFRQALPPPKPGARTATVT